MLENFTFIVVEKLSENTNYELNSYFLNENLLKHLIVLMSIAIFWQIFKWENYTLPIKYMLLG